MIRYLADATAKAAIGAVCLCVAIEAAQWAHILIEMKRKG